MTTRNRLSSRIAEKTGLSYQEVRKLLAEVRGSVVEALSDGEDAVIPGLCSFHLRHLPAEKRVKKNIVPPKNHSDRYQVRCRIFGSVEAVVNEELMLEDEGVTTFRF